MNNSQTQQRKRRRAKHKSTDNLYSNIKLQQTQRIQTIISNTQQTPRQTHRFEQIQIKKLKRLRMNEWSPWIIQKLIQILSPYKQTCLLEEIILILQRTMSEVFKMKNEINVLKQKNCEYEQQIWNLKRDKKRIEASFNHIKEQQTSQLQIMYTMKQKIKELKERQSELIEFIVSHNLKKINNRKVNRFENEDDNSDEQADVSVLSESECFLSFEKEQKFDRKFRNAPPTRKQSQRIQ